MPACMEGTGLFPQNTEGVWDIAVYLTADEAYIALMRGLMDILKISIGLVDNAVPTFFIDGGFARNAIFMGMLKYDFPHKNIKTLDVPQATALGALLFLKKDKILIYNDLR